MNNTFDFKLLKNLLGKGPEVVDCSHIGKMRDVYPLKLFTLRNINTLIEKFTDCDNFEEKKNVATCIICFLPCVLWLNATTNKIFSPNCRVFLLKLTFEFVGVEPVAVMGPPGVVESFSGRSEIYPDMADRAQPLVGGLIEFRIEEARFLGGSGPQRVEKVQHMLGFFV